MSHSGRKLPNWYIIEKNEMSVDWFVSLQADTSLFLLRMLYTQNQCDMPHYKQKMYIERKYDFLFNVERAVAHDFK